MASTPLFASVVPLGLCRDAMARGLKQWQSSLVSLKARGLKQWQSSPVTPLAKFKVTLLTPDGEKEIECPENKHILDVALEKKLDIPAQVSCWNGTCYTCAGKLLEGEVHHSKESDLTLNATEKGFVLTCVACPRSNVTIETHAEEKLVDM